MPRPRRSPRPVPPSALPATDPPASAAETRRQLERLGRRARKALGQHFLVRPDVAERIVQLAAIAPHEAVVEIGPGLGALTASLVTRSPQLWLVELDPDFAALLRERYASAAHVEVVQADACAVDWTSFPPTSAPLVVTGNLPYNIATPLLARLLAAGPRIARIVVMLQREVAERLRARLGEPGYSALSVLTQAAASVHKGFRVSPTAFLPAPKVESEVVVLYPRQAQEIRNCGFARLRAVVRAAFAQRRKQLRNSLASLAANPQAWLAAAGIEPQRRAETLSLAEFAALAEALPAFAHHA